MSAVAVPKTPFSQADAVRAFDEWGCNCGPSAVAAVTGNSLDDLRPYLGDFEKKRYTNPMLMRQILNNLGIKWHNAPDLDWPEFGLVRIQWHGPWMRPGVPIRARYRHTHWVGCCAENRSNIGIFDVNAMSNETGWCALDDWTKVIVPWILENCVPNSDGNWSITHSIEI